MATLLPKPAAWTSTSAGARSRPAEQGRNASTRWAGTTANARRDTQEIQLQDVLVSNSYEAKDENTNHFSLVLPSCWSWTIVNSPLGNYSLVWRYFNQHNPLSVYSSCRTSLYRLNWVLTQMLYSLLDQGSKFETVFQGLSYAIDLDKNHHWEAVVRLCINRITYQPLTAYISAVVTTFIIIIIIICVVCQFRCSPCHLYPTMVQNYVCSSVPGSVLRKRTRTITHSPQCNSSAAVF